jgi:CelD/BcsL family acetyltransferase involved in cellulose biosynthesis
MPDWVHGMRNPLTTLATSARDENCHAVSLAGTWEEFSRRHLPNLRDSNRRRRKLDKLGTVRFAIAETDAERRKFFDAMVQMKRQRFADTGAQDIFNDPGYFDYYAEITRVLGPAGTIQLSALMLDGRILAADWGFVSGNRFYDLLPSYRAGEWRSYSPGRLLTEWLTEHCLERGLDSFDYGIGDEPYKLDYCDNRIPLNDAHLPVTAKGAVYGGLMRAQAATKSLLRDTKIGGMLKAARNRIRELKPARPAAGRDYTPAVTALICSVTLAVDAA